MSLGQLGQFTVLLAMGLSGYGLVTGLLGLALRDGRLLASARFAAVTLFLALTGAMAVMETALLTDDFSVKYVAETSSTIVVVLGTLYALLPQSHPVQARQTRAVPR